MDITLDELNTWAQKDIVLSQARVLRAAETEEASPVGLPPSLERQRLACIERLGSRWILHKSHAPKKGNYDGWPKPIGT